MMMQQQREVFYVADSDEEEEQTVRVVPRRQSPQQQQQRRQMSRPFVHRPSSAASSSSASSSSSSAAASSEDHKRQLPPPQPAAPGQPRRSVTPPPRKVTPPPQQQQHVQMQQMHPFRPPFGQHPQHNNFRDNHVRAASSPAWLPAALERPASAPKRSFALSQPQPQPSAQLAAATATTTTASDAEVSPSEEVRRFAAYIALTPEELLLRRGVVDRIRACVRRVWGDAARVRVFGSVRTGLCLPASDIDLTVETRGISYPPMPVLSLALQHDTASFENIEEITRARVPLIKLRDVATNISVDISFNTTSGTKNTAVVRRLLTDYPQVRPLALFFKYLLYQSQLNEPYYGGLGSYTLVLMIVSFIQHKIKEAKARGVPPPADLAFLVMDFLRLYGTDFNYSTTGISVRDGGSYFPKAKRGWLDEQRPFLLSVEDPADIENDVGRNSFEIMSVRGLFARAHASLAEALMGYERGLVSPSWLSRAVIVSPQLIAYREWAKDQFRLDPRISAGQNVFSDDEDEDDDDDENGDPSKRQ